MELAVELAFGLGIKKTLKETIGDKADLSPFVVPGATDTLYTGPPGAVAYGFAPTSPDVEYRDLNRLVHGVNERIKVKTRYTGTDFLISLCKNLNRGSRNPKEANISFLQTSRATIPIVAPLLERFSDSARQAWNCAVGARLKWELTSVLRLQRSGLEALASNCDSIFRGGSGSRRILSFGASQSPEHCLC